MKAAGNLRTLYGDIVSLFWDNYVFWFNPTTSQIYTYQMIRGQNRNIFITPNLKQAAINHYGCSTLLGIQGGGNQIQLEKSILLNESLQDSYSDISTCFTVMSVAVI